MGMMVGRRLVYFRNNRLSGECMYVGQSRDVKNRVSQHRGQKPFDRWTVMACEECDLDAFETRMIRALRPKHNSIVLDERNFPKTIQLPIHARMATLEQLMETTLPLFIYPVPSKDTLRDWFDKAKIPRTKSNPVARRGGGPVYYSVAAIEKMLSAKTTSGKLARL